MAEKKLILGIDDAGRGPVTGPMVLAGVLTTEEDAQRFKEMGIRDSKLLFPDKREELARIIKNLAIGFHAIKITPLEIDESLASGINLNTLEAIRAAMIINLLLGARKEDVVIQIDCPSNNTSAWRKTLLSYVKEDIIKRITVKCEHKADLNYPACSAASIIAKTTRDTEIEKIKEQIGEDFGSGYPSDPTTIEFLKKNWNKYKDLHIFRESWQTYKNVSNGSGSKKQKKLF